MRAISILLTSGLMLLSACAANAGAPGKIPAPGLPDVGTGATCGGIAALQCGDPADYCAMPPGTCHKIADGAGECTKKPEICTMIYAPVCGCDGKTYPSDCNAASKGVSVAYPGECRD